MKIIYYTIFYKFLNKQNKALHFLSLSLGLSNPESNLMRLYCGCLFRDAIKFFVSQNQCYINQAPLYLFHSPFAMFKRAEGTADTQKWSVGATTDDTMWNLLASCSADSSKRNVLDLKFARTSRPMANC